MHDSEAVSNAIELFFSDDWLTILFFQITFLRFNKDFKSHFSYMLLTSLGVWKCLSYLNCWDLFFFLECSNQMSSVDFSLVGTEQLQPMECYRLQMFLPPMPLPLLVLWDLTTMDTDLLLLPWMELFVHGSWKLEGGAMFVQQNLPSALTITPRKHSYTLKSLIIFLLHSDILLQFLSFSVAPL